MTDYRYHCDECGKTYIGPPLGGMDCNCTPPKRLVGKPYVPTPVHYSAALTKSLDRQDADNLRDALCDRWLITNKSHKFHKGNMSGNQSVVSLINNICEKVIGDDRERVRLLVIRDYSYDIDTQLMVEK